MQRAERVVGCQSVSEPTKLAVSCAWQSLKAAPKQKDEGGSASKHGMSMRRTLHDFFNVSSLGRVPAGCASGSTAA